MVARRRRTSVRVGLIIGAVFAVVAVTATLRLVQVARDLRAVRDALNTAESQLKAGQPAAARQSALKAEVRAAHAATILHNRPELTILYPIPVIHQNLAALRTVVGVALRLGTAGVSILQTAKPLETPDGTFEVPMRAGALPLATINRLRPDLRSLAESLPVAAEAPKSRLILPPVKDLNKTVYAQSTLRRRQALTLSDALDLLAEMSGSNGPARFLVAVANAAEMRGTGGMILAYGQLTSADGTFSLERFGGIDDLALKDAAPTPPTTPPDYLSRFADLSPTKAWRNANLGGDFTYIGPVLESMYDKALGRPADGVIQIDSMGLAALMRGTGPVEVKGLGTVTADNVVRVTLSDAYTRFPTERTERQEVLGDVAEAVFKKLVTGAYPSLRPLATALVDAVAERRIMLHLAKPAEQRHVAALAAEGRLPLSGADMATLTVQNFAGNKLDYYLDTKVKLTGDRRPGSLGRVQAEVTIENTAPRGSTSPVYVFGPFSRSFTAGQYVGLASLYVPAGTSIRSARGDLSKGAAGVSAEAGRSVITFPVRVNAGSRISVVLDLQLPPGPGKGYRLDLVPASRVRPTTYDVRFERGDGRRPITFNGPLLRERVFVDSSR